MTEVTAKYKLFLAVGMVVTGTLNTISTKERFQFAAFLLANNGAFSSWTYTRIYRQLGNRISHLENPVVTWKQRQPTVFSKSEIVSNSKTFPSLRLKLKSS